MQRAWLDRDSTTGLVALSGGREGDVGRALLAGREEEAARALESWLGLFDDRYYLELTRTGRPGEEECAAGCLALAVRLGVPVVASNDVRFVARGDYEAHEARVCIHDGTMLASGDGDWNRPGDIRIWNTETWKESGGLRHTGEVLSLSFSPNAQILAAGSWDKTVKVWDLSKGVPKLPAPKESK